MGLFVETLAEIIVLSAGPVCKERRSHVAVC